MRTSAVALAGSVTPPLTSTVTRAFHVAGSTAMADTAPTGTSATFTNDCGTRSTTSASSIVTA